mgnify:CR=1 FL=1|tara:strand:+ start:164 stop:763 length:600 start_codon:yes stop_codon:yes gene_type:complete
MVLFTITAKFNANTGNKAKVKIVGGVNLQKLKLVGYAISLNGITIDEQAEIVTAAGRFSGHILPNQVIVNLDVVGTSQIHNATSRKTNGTLQTSPPVENTNPYSTGIPLPIGDTLKTIQFGMSGIEFDIGKTIHNEIIVEALKYDDEGGLIPMPTGTPLKVKADGTVETGGGAAAANKFGSTTIQMITLYFNYDFNSYF